MRTIKIAILSVIGIALIIVGAANMAPVDLYLLPAAAGMDALSLKGVPLAAVIVVSVLVGVVVGQLMEWLRERKYRKSVNEQQREIKALKQRNGEMVAKLGDDAEDLGLPAR